MQIIPAVKLFPNRKYPFYLYSSRMYVLMILCFCGFVFLHLSLNKNLKLFNVGMFLFTIFSKDIFNCLVVMWWKRQSALWFVLQGPWTIYFCSKAWKIYVIVFSNFVVADCDASKERILYINIPRNISLVQQATFLPTA